MKLIYFLMILLFSSNSFAQIYKKDVRSKEQKEDPLNEYNEAMISKFDMLSVMQTLGIRIFKFSFTAFDKEYKIAIKLDEYVEGKKINSKIIYQEMNTYPYYEETEPGKYIAYKDYLDQLTFYSKSTDSASILSLKTYALQIGTTLKTRKIRVAQTYMYRTYSKTPWKLNQEVPLLIYASSWYDNKTNVERFCGVVDLSYNQKVTQELLDNSPHYFVVSYKVLN